MAIAAGILLTAAAAPPSLAGCPMFPEDNIWNWPVDDLPVLPLSDTYVETVGRSAPVHPDFGSGLWEGGPIGIPFVIVPWTQPRVPLSFEYADESDPGPYPIPPDAPIEGGPDSSGDRHILVLDEDACVLYEVFDAHPNPDGSWRAGSGAIFDLRDHALRPDGWTSADAAGLPILPGLVRYDEVAAGEIRHAIRFTVPRTQRRYVWPARHFASRYLDPFYPPMGLRMRLRADFDESDFSPEAQVIARALKRYGMILADNGSAWFLSGAPDERWDNDALRDLRQISGADFEAVDTSGLMDDPDSGRVKGAATEVAPTVEATATGTPTVAPSPTVAATAAPSATAVASPPPSPTLGEPTPTARAEPESTPAIVPSLYMPWTEVRVRVNTSDALNGGGTVKGATVKTASQRSSSASEAPTREAGARWWTRCSTTLRTARPTGRSIAFVKMRRRQRRVRAALWTMTSCTCWEQTGRKSVSSRRSGTAWTKICARVGFALSSSRTRRRGHCVGWWSS